jgi:hypothetical protein
VFAEGDTVELVSAIPIYGLEAGDIGTVVGIYPDNRTYRVAFTRRGKPVQTCDVPYIQLRRHARNGGA